MAEVGRSTYPDVLRDLFATGMSAYPAAVNAMVGYWSEMLANASSYSAEVVQSMIAAVQSPGHGSAILTDLATRLKAHLQRSGDITERTILEFNQRLEAILRGAPVGAPAGPRGGGDRALGALRSVATLAATEAWTIDESHGAPDLRVLRHELEALLSEICRLEGQPSPRDPSSSPHGV